MGEVRLHCEACERDVEVAPPSAWWKLANVGVWTFIIVGGPFLAVMPPLNLVTIPVFFVAAAAMVGFVSDKLAAAPACPRCGRDVPVGAAAQPLRTSPGVRPVQRTNAL